MLPSNNSESGNSFYVNLPSATLRNCFNNPSTVKKIVSFPEVPLGINNFSCTILYYTSEIYQAERWHNEFKSPMYASKVGNIFVNDFVRLHHATLDDVLGKVLKVLY